MTRAAIAAISCAFFVGILHAACVSAISRESSSNVRIQVTLRGKPLEGAKVIFRPSSQYFCNCATDVLRGNPLNTSKYSSSSSRITDENGIVNLPELAPGDYEVAASFHDVASTAFAGLHVSSKLGVTTVPMDLTLQVERVEEVPLRRHISAFRGTVRDLTGATLPGANIVVVKRGSQVKDVVLRTEADAKGDFSSELENGQYIAVFFSPGFRPAIVAFEVTQEGDGELPVSLWVGGCP